LIVQGSNAKTIPTPFFGCTDAHLSAETCPGETAMSRENSKERRMIAIGLIGIIGLLAVSLGYALLDSGTHYETEQINRFVLDQQSAETENAR
jgi:hypothetical protein